MTKKEMLDNNREIGLEDNPEFNKARRVHDWRNYIPEELRKVWRELSYEARIVAYLTVKPMADREEWD